MNLADLGWNPCFEESFSKIEGEGLMPARVGREDREMYVLLAEAGELRGRVSGRLLHLAGSKGDFPGVGDWVAAELHPGERKATIHAVIPRKSGFVRKVAGGRTEQQVVAANVDTVFIVSGLDGGRNFNLRGIERYLAEAWESGASPVLILNKVDVCDDAEAKIAEAETVSAGTPIHAVSATERTGLDVLERYLGRGKTVALLGPSGVGKSALVNALSGGERQQTGAVRENDVRGRHTTTRRELTLLDDGGVIIDTPGMRQLQLWSESGDLGDAFGDVEELAASCRFRDCAHRGEPGCAIHKAIGEGTFDVGRYDGYLKLQKELAHLARRQDVKAQMEEKAKWKGIAQWSRQMRNERGR